MQPSTRVLDPPAIYTRNRGLFVFGETWTIISIRFGLSRYRQDTDFVRIPIYRSHGFLSAQTFRDSRFEFSGTVTDSIAYPLVRSSLKSTEATHRVCHDTLMWPRGE